MSAELHRARYKIGYLKKYIKNQLQIAENDKCDLQAQVSAQRQTIDTLKNRELKLEEKSGNRKKEIKILLQKIEKLQEKKITSADSKLRDAQRLHDQASKLLEVNDRLKEENARLQKIIITTSNPMEMPPYQYVPDVPSSYQLALGIGQGFQWCGRFESGSSCSDDSSCQESENNDMASHSFSEYEREDEETFPDESFQIYIPKIEYDSDPEDFSEVIFLSSNVSPPWHTKPMMVYKTNDDSSQYESEIEQEEDEASVQSDDTYVTAPLFEEPDNSECHNDTGPAEENVPGYPVDLPFPIEEELCVIDSDVEGVKQDRLCKLVTGEVTGQNEHAHSPSVSVQQMQEWMSLTSSNTEHEEKVEVTIGNQKPISVPRLFFDHYLLKVDKFRCRLRLSFKRIRELESEVGLHTSCKYYLEDSMDSFTQSVREIYGEFIPNWLEITEVLKPFVNLVYSCDHWCKIIAGELQLPHTANNISEEFKDWCTSGCDYRSVIHYNMLIEACQESPFPQLVCIGNFLDVRLLELIARRRSGARAEGTCIACNRPLIAAQAKDKTLIDVVLSEEETQPPVARSTALVCSEYS